MEVRKMKLFSHENMTNHRGVFFVRFCASVAKNMDTAWRKKGCILLILVSGTLGFAASAQDSFPHYPDSLFSSYYHQRASQFKILPCTPDDIIFLGNSITDGGNWPALFNNKRVKNFGISGDVTKGVLNRLKSVVKRKPAKVFLLIGTNDLAAGVRPDTILKNIDEIVSLIHYHSPITKVFVQSIFPVNPARHKFPNHVNKGEDIDYINDRLRLNAEDKSYTYVDVSDALKDSKDHLNRQYTNDGLHLLGAGYMVWKHVVYPYVFDLQPKPSVIPKPQFLEWNSQRFPLYRCHRIIYKEDSLRAEALMLQRYFKQEGLVADVGTNVPGSNPSVELRVGEVNTPLCKEEAYTLTVNTDKITITGNTAHGVFNGIQTLRQLMRDGTFIDGCTIKDWPAFSWRGYMIDVGRNYQSVDQIKQQIREMAHYKMNVFHFHLTENVAWRLQIKRYPQLTMAKNMTRNKGQYYTIAEMKELIQYCKDRFITLVPEIDMPGHSAAFKRAMGVDMQSDSGLAIMKNILTEVDSTYDIPYIHIGADEVKFTNKKFLPEMVSLIHSQGKQTIGWNPGGNYDPATIRQMWKSEGIDHPEQTDVNTRRIVDSRRLYLNHKDPLSGVPSLFYKKICDVNHGTLRLLGGEICLWNDDRAKDEKDILEMNFAYPAIITFAERAWRGGGYQQMTAALGADTSERFKKFVNFESRLLDQKKEFFKDKPFPYVRQTNIHWKLFGPFDNHGDATAKFWPELITNSLVDSAARLTINGGTVWLRHFFTPVIKGVLKDPQPNTTWYAYRRIYSPIDTTGYFWISFYNPSRSHAPMTPHVGQWDFRGSKLWINGRIVPPPQWTYPGRTGSWETPLVDESYEYRPATKVPLKKGWNTILVKAPVESFKGVGWQHPVKWMFTVVRVNPQK